MQSLLWCGISPYRLELTVAIALYIFILYFHGGRVVSPLPIMKVCKAKAYFAKFLCQVSIKKSHQDIGGK